MPRKAYPRTVRTRVEIRLPYLLADIITSLAAARGMTREQFIIGKLVVAIPELEAALDTLQANAVDRALAGEANYAPLDDDATKAEGPEL